MPDDEDEERREHTVDTVPPPPGESDVYGAKTQVGGLSAEALAMLRQMRDERPLPATSHEANVPVFLDDEGPAGARPRTQAAIHTAVTHRPNAPVLDPFGARTKAPPATTDPPQGTTMRPFLLQLPPLPAISPHLAVTMPPLAGVSLPPGGSSAFRGAVSIVEPKSGSEGASGGLSIPVEHGAPEDDPGVSRRPAPLEIPTAPAFLPLPAPAQGGAGSIFESDDADEDEDAPASYVPVFGPASGQPEVVAAPVPATRRPGALTIVTAVVLLALALVLVIEAGWLTGVLPGRSKPVEPIPVSPAPPR